MKFNKYTIFINIIKDNHMEYLINTIIQTILKNIHCF